MRRVVSVRVEIVNRRTRARDRNERRLDASGPQIGWLQSL